MNQSKSGIGGCTKNSGYGGIKSGIHAFMRAFDSSQEKRKVGVGSRSLAIFLKRLWDLSGEAPLPLPP